MHLDLVDRSFQVTAESWLRSLDDVTIADLEMLFRASPGYFPTTLLARLHQVELGSSLHSNTNGVHAGWVKSRWATGSSQ